MLKNENLEQELRHKGQELVNLLINLNNKNDILNNTKQGLMKILSEGKEALPPNAKRMIMTLNSRIDADIVSDNTLKRFEDEFDLVHNNFITLLAEKHPDLTSTERKMCSCIRMGLSTKEIAPVMNMSIRGVETLRYRLRKKFELEREDSLTEYLNSL